MSVLYIRDKDGKFVPVPTIGGGGGGGSGEDGLTPYIGENGNWWIGDTDTGTKAAGLDGRNGIDGKDGLNGKDGVDGKDGKTPEKGVDYFTETDKSEMVQSVLAALPDYREVAH